MQLICTLSGRMMMSVPFWHSCLHFPSICSFHLFTGSDWSVSLRQFRGLRLVYRPGWNWSGWRHRRRGLRMEREWHSFRSVEQSVVEQVAPLSRTHHRLECKQIIRVRLLSVVSHAANKDGGRVHTGRCSTLFSSRLRHKNNVAV